MVKYAIVSMFLVLMSLKGQTQPIKVEIKKEGESFKLYRGGEPYYIKGAGGQEYLDKVVEYGGNSIRTWSPDNAKKILDEAHKLGLTVTMGLWVGHERHGFNYDDEWAVKGQLETFREVVKELKDHPALLIWGVGNEMDLFYSNFKVWDAVNDIAEMIHEEDPNHPTMVVTAGIDVAEIQLIQKRAPAIDILGINTYADLLNIPKAIDLYGWDGPYMITEWGPNGHWEVFKTEWGAPVEQTGTEKAASYLERYQEYIAKDQQQCIGSYVFLWGQKQETTPTWYGVFTAEGKETEATDVLSKVWSGKLPENKTPKIEEFKLDGKNAYQNVHVKSGANCVATAEIKDPEGADLKYVWELMPESMDTKAGGDFESKPKPLISKGSDSGQGRFSFKAPEKEGAYRIFVYAYDDDNNVAIANIPFYVQ